MKTWEHITHYAGFDWAKDHHDVIVLDASGKIAADFRFEHSASGWEQFRERLLPFPNIAIAAETKNGMAIERLLELELCAFAVRVDRDEHFASFLRMIWTVAGQAKGANEPNGRNKFNFSPNLRVGLP